MLHGQQNIRIYETHYRLFQIVYFDSQVKKKKKTLQQYRKLRHVTEGSFM